MPPWSGTRSSSCRTTSSAACSSAARRSYGVGRTTAFGCSRRSKRRLRSSRRTSCSISRMSPFSALPHDSGSPPALWPSGFPTRVPTSVSTHHVSSRSATPSIAVIGTGKRVGKTAVTGHVASELARERSVVVVAMGRGGPAEPELVEVETDRRGSAPHLARRPARGVRSPRDRCTDRRADRRLPPLRRWSRRCRRHVERRRRRPSRPRSSIPT